MLRGRTTFGESTSFARGLWWTGACVTALAAAALCVGSNALAATVTLLGDDPAGTAAFNTSGNVGNGANGYQAGFNVANWSDGNAPAAANDYVVSQLTFRSPTASAGTAAGYVFAGQSLTLTDGARWLMKNGTSTANDNLTVNNLILDAANVRPNSNTPTASALLGTIKVTSNGAIITQSNSTNDFLTINSKISDNSLNAQGAIALGGDDQLGGGTINKRITLTPLNSDSTNGSNTYTGPTYLLGGNVQLGNSGALPSGTTLYFGSGNSLNGNGNGNATLDLNGQTVTVQDIALQSYTTSTALLTGTQPSATVNGTAQGTPRRIVRVAPIAPGTVKIGQVVAGTLNSGGTTATTMVIGIYNDPGNAFTDIVLGDNVDSNNANNGTPNNPGQGNTGFNNLLAGSTLTGLTFSGATQPLASSQVIGNGANTNATLTISGNAITHNSTFAGSIVDGVIGNPSNTTVGTGKTNITFPGNTLTLSGPLTYTGTTTISGTGGSLVLSYPTTTTVSTFASPTNLSGSGSSLVMNYAGTASNYNAAISGGGSVIKNLPGTATFTGASTYSGATTVNGGTLALDFTTSSSSNVAFTVSSSTITQGNVPNGTGIVFTAGQPTGTSLNTAYYVVNSTATTFQISATPGGSAITFSGANGAALALNRYDRAANILNNVANNSALTLAGGTLQVKGGATFANSQQFNGLNLSSAGAITLTTNGIIAKDVAVNVGAINRTQGGVLLLTNPSGTLSATNGLQTSSGTSGAIITASGTPYVVVNSADWGKKNAGGWVEALAPGDYTATDGTSLTGNADIVGTDATLASGGAPTSVRFSGFTANRMITISGGTLVTGGVLVTNGANATGFTQTIAGGSVQAPSAGADLVLVENNTKGSLNINSAIIDNSGSGLATAGVGTINLGGANTYVGNTSIGGGTLNLSAKQAFYSGTVSGATASKVTVNTGATLGLSLGGSGFAVGDVGTILTNANFKPGSALGLDTTSGTASLGQAVTDTASGANPLGLTKNGANTLQLFGGNNSYSGPTTINGGTLQLASGGSLSGNSLVTIGSGASLDLAGGSASVSGLSGTGSVALGTGGSLALTSAAASPTAVTISNAFSGSGSLSFNVPSAVTLTLTASTGAAAGFTVANGTVALAPTSGTPTWGSLTANTFIAPSTGSTGALTVGKDATLQANNIVVTGSAIGNTDGPILPQGGGTGTLTVNAANTNPNTVNVLANTLYINTPGGLGTNGATTATVALSAGTVELKGTPFASWSSNNTNLGQTAPGGNITNFNLAIAMAPNRSGVVGNQETANLNITGGTLKIDNNGVIVGGSNYTNVENINISGATTAVTFYSDLAGTVVGGAGFDGKAGIYFANNNGNGGSGSTSALNFSQGTLTVPQIVNQGNATVPIIRWWGGKIVAAVDTNTLPVNSLFYGIGTTTNVSTPSVRVGRNGNTGTGIPTATGGAVIDVNGHNVTIGVPLIHDTTNTTGSVDDGLTLSSTTAGGVLTLDPRNSPAGTTTPNTYNGMTNILSGRLVPANPGAISTSAGINVTGANSIYDIGSLGAAPHLFANQTLSGVGGTITGSFQHQVASATISPGSGNGLGTVGTLTFDTYLELTGGRARFDLSNTSGGSNDQITVTGSSGLAANGSPSFSVVQIEMPTLASGQTTYQLIKFPNGSFTGQTTPITINSVTYDVPRNLTLASTSASINGRSALLAVNSTTKSLDLVFFANGKIQGNLTWDGGAGGTQQTWDTANTAGWKNSNPVTDPDKFFTGDAVTFDDTAVTHRDILISGTVAPGAFASPTNPGILITSTGSNNYSFSPTAAGDRITGTGGLTKTATSSSTLTMNTANNYSGATQINAGIVNCLDPGDGTTTGSLGRGSLALAAGAATPVQLLVGNGTSGAGTLSQSSLTTSGNSGSATIIVNRPDSFNMTTGAMTSGQGTTLNVTYEDTTAFHTGHLTLFAAGSTYTGSTTIDGTIVTGGVANSFSTNSVYTLTGTANSTLDTNALAQTVGGLVSSATTSTVALGVGTTGSLTIASGAATGTTTYAGQITGNGSLTVNLTNVAGATESFTTSSGPSLANLNASGGTTLLAPVSPTAWGTATTTTTIAGPAPATVPIPGNLTLAAGATLNSNIVVIGGNSPTGATGGIGTLNVNTSSSVVNANAIYFGGTGGVSTAGTSSETLNLSNGGTISLGSVAPNSVNVGQNQGALGTIAVGIWMAANNNGNGNLNISGSTSAINLNNNSSIVMGQFNNRPATITQSAGSVNFYSDIATTPGGTGALYFDNNNSTPGSGGTYRYLLLGGTLQVPSVQNKGSVASNATTSNTPNGPMLYLNGGTLMAAQDNADFITGTANTGNGALPILTSPPIVWIGGSATTTGFGGSGGAIIDSNGHDITIKAQLIHDRSIAGLDDGLTIKSSTGNGIVRLNPSFTNAGTAATTNTFNGPVNIVSGTLQPQSAGALAGTASITLGASGKYDGSQLAKAIGPNQSVGGTGTIIGATFTHQNATGVLSPGANNSTAGTLSMASGINFAMTGGKLRFDLGTSDGTSDHISVGSGSTVSASGPAANTSVVDVEFIGSVPGNTSFNLINFPGSTWSGGTTDINMGPSYPFGDIVGGNRIVHVPNFLTLFSSNTAVTTRSNTQLNVDTTSGALQLFFLPGTQANLTWRGLSSPNSVWDLQTTANWLNNGTLLGDQFFNNDRVTFDDDPGGFPHAITVKGSVNPTVINVNSSTGRDYSFSPDVGGAQIGGGGSLTKDGSSTLTMSVANNYSGGTNVINGTLLCLDSGDGSNTSAIGVGNTTVGASGILQVGNAPTNTGTIAGTINNSGQIVIKRSDTALSIGAKIDGAGTVAIQGGGTVAFTNAFGQSTYSGNTNVTGGSTVQATVDNGLSTGSTYNLDATSQLKTFATSQSLGGISGSGTTTATGGSLTFTGSGIAGTGTTVTNGGPLLFTSGTISTTGGSVSTATGAATAGGTITFSGVSTNMSGAGSLSSGGGAITFTGTAGMGGAGTFITGTASPATGFGAINFNDNVAATFTGVLNASTSAINVNGGTSQDQSLNLAAGSTTTGAITVTNGKLRLSSTVAGSFGATGTNVIIGAGTGNTGTLVVDGAGVTLLASALRLSGQGDLGSNGGTGTFTQSAGTVNVGVSTNAAGGAINLNTNGAGFATINLSGGTLTGGSMALATNGVATNQSTPQGLVNISGTGTLNIWNTSTTGNPTIQYGQFNTLPATINQTGGTVMFTTSQGGATSNPSGRIIFNQNNSPNMGQYIYNLTGGTLAVGGIGIQITATGNGTVLNLRPTVNFGGGTLKALSAGIVVGTNPAQFFNSTVGTVTPTIPGGNGAGPGAPEPILTIVNASASPSKIDTNGFAVTMDNAFAHDQTLGAAADGGLEVNDTATTAGSLTLTGAGGTFNGGLKITRGTVVGGTPGNAAFDATATVTADPQVINVPTTTVLSVGEAITGDPNVPAGTVIAQFTTFAIGPATGSGFATLRFGTTNVPLAPAAGTMYVILSNPTTFTAGATPTLHFGATSPLGTGPLTLNGGTFTGQAGTTRDYSATTVLKMSASSKIDLGTGAAETLKFANSNGVWTGTLTVNGWIYNSDHLDVGADSTGLSSTQLGQIKFADFAQGASIRTIAGVGEVTPQIGDIDQDTHVNVADVSALMTAFSDKNVYQALHFTGATDPAGDVAFILDVNRDNSANNLDVQAEINLLANGGSSAPGGGNLTPVPEPSTIVLLALGGLIVCGQRYRRRAKR
jgi:fibronectin-binding autotransporter adhesin